MKAISITIELNEDQTNEVKTHLESALRKEYSNEELQDFINGMFNFELSRVILNPLIQMIDNHGENIRIYESLENEDNNE
jgi:hypothetical protein